MIKDKGITTQVSIIQKDHAQPSLWHLWKMPEGSKIWVIGIK